jgi:hypothetical protein
MEEKADEALIKIERVAERRIEEAIKAGEFDNLPGAGKPLKIEDNPFVPREMRAAYTVLANSGYAPDWMVLAQRIDVEMAKMRAAADRHFAHLRRELERVASDPYAVKRLKQELDRLRMQHKRASARHALAVEQINRDIRTFNNTVPIASLMMVPLAEEDEMHRFEDRVPAFLGYMQEP